MALKPWILIVFISILWIGCDEGQMKSESTLAGTTQEEPTQEEIDEYLQNKPAPALSEAEIMQAGGRFITPSPAEIFNALGKVGVVDWNGVVNYQDRVSQSYDSEHLRALNLGVRAADAFIAIQAEDEVNFGEMTTSIFDLTGNLGLQDVFTEQQEIIAAYADEGDWGSLRGALDSLQYSIEVEIENLNKDDWVTLAAVAGWLEGMRVVASHVGENYDEESASLFYQPRLVEYYQAEMDSLSADLKEDGLIMKMNEGLEEIATLIKVESADQEKSIPEENVVRLHALSEEIINHIVQGAS